MPEIDIQTVHQSVCYLQSMMEDTKEHSQKTYPFTAFQAENSDHCLASVDGSHHNIKGSHFVFSAIRSGYQIYRNGHLTDANIFRTKIEILTKSNYKDRHREYFQNITGQTPTELKEFEKVSERIRTLLEWDKIQQLLERLGDGDVILFDGSMISGVISTNQSFFHAIEEKAKQKGIILAGLSKDTSLMEGAASVPRLLAAAAAVQCPNSDWFVPYKDTYFVKFIPTTDLVFRLDLVLPDGVRAEDAIKRIAAYAYDAGEPGYPYPMQTIHDAVRISRSQVYDCLDYFKSECLKQHIPLSYVEELFQIYHDQLDIFSHGR